MKFSECVEIVGSKPSRYQGIKQYVSTGSLDSDHIDENSIEEYAYDDRPSRADLVAEAGNVLFAKMAETKKTLVINNQNEKYLFSTGFFAVKPKKNVLTTECLYYLLNSNTFLSQKDKYSSGATQKAISNASLEKIIVNIPCFSKQEDIVKQLDKLSNIIKKTRKQLLNFDLLIKSRFIEMFGDPVQNPKKWDIKKMSDYILFLTSGSRGWSEYFSNKGELFLTIKNVKNNRINIENIQYVQAPNNKEAERTKVQENDLLISITADLGRTGVVSKEIANYGAYINQHLSLVRLNTEKVNPLFVSYYLETDGGKLQFNKKNQSAVKAGLNFEAIKSLTFMNPPLKKQNEFVSFVQQIDKSKFENTTQEIAA